jgi:hypothetical protein
MEKRKDNRIKKKLTVRFYFEGTAFHSVTGDMSRRGIFIETLHPCPPGKGINIEIDGKNQKINLAGFIRWNQRDNGSPTMSLAGGMGVQLLNYQKPEYQSLVSETYG